MVTAAHVVEPILPGARDSYIDLGKFYDAGRLEKRRRELNEFNSRYKKAYADAYRYLAAAGSLNIYTQSDIHERNIEAAAENCAALLPPSAPDKSGIRHCFLDAFCSKGEITLLKNAESWSIYTIQASVADGSSVLDRLGQKLSANAYNVIFCHNPLDPKLLRHILVPCHKTVFTLSRTDSSRCAAALHMPAEDSEKLALHKTLTDTALRSLSDAKCNHDALEEVYNPCVDFSGIYSEAKKHINTIL